MKMLDFLYMNWKKSFILDSIPKVLLFLCCMKYKGVNEGKWRDNVFWK